MEQFNINNVIEHYNLDTEALAKVLFPTVKYPKQAFDRVLKGETDLDIRQIENLASYIGVLVTDLFSAGAWKGSSEGGCLMMQKGDYKVKLNYNGVFLSIYKGDTLIEQRISNVPAMTMQQFIDYLDTFIKTYEDGSI